MCVCVCVCVCVCLCVLTLTRNVGQAVTSISKVASHLHIISSKQRPRKCTMKGSDGNTYQYLLKVCHVLVGLFSSFSRSLLLI